MPALGQESPSVTPVNPEEFHPGYDPESLGLPPDIAAIARQNLDIRATTESRDVPTAGQPSSGHDWLGGLNLDSLNFLSTVGEPPSDTERADDAAALAPPASPSPDAPAAGLRAADLISQKHDWFDTHPGADWSRLETPTQPMPSANASTQPRPAAAAHEQRRPAATINQPNFALYHQVHMQEHEHAIPDKVHTQLVRGSVETSSYEYWHDDASIRAEAQEFIDQSTRWMRFDVSNTPRPLQLPLTAALYAGYAAGKVIHAADRLVQWSATREARSTVIHEAGALAGGFISRVGKVVVTAGGDIVNAAATGVRAAFNRDQATGRVPVLRNIAAGLGAAQVDWHNGRPARDAAERRLDELGGLAATAAVNTREARNALWNATTHRLATITGARAVTAIYHKAESLAGAVASGMRRRRDERDPDEVYAEHLASTSNVSPLIIDTNSNSQFMDSDQHFRGRLDRPAWVDKVIAAQRAQPVFAAALVADQGPATQENRVPDLIHHVTEVVLPPASDPLATKPLETVHGGPEPLSPFEVKRVDGSKVDLNIALAPKPPVGTHWEVVLAEVDEEGRVSAPTMIGYPDQSEIVNAVRGWTADNPNLRMLEFRLAPNDWAAVTEAIASDNTPAQQPEQAVVSEAQPDLPIAKEAVDTVAHGAAAAFGNVTWRALRDGFVDAEIMPAANLRTFDAAYADINQQVSQPVLAAVRQAADASPAIRLALASLPEEGFISHVLTHAVAAQYPDPQAITASDLTHHVPALTERVLTTVEEMGNQVYDRQITYWNQSLGEVRRAIEQYEPMGIRPEPGDYRYTDETSRLAQDVASRLETRTNQDVTRMLQVAQQVNATPLVTRVDEALQVAGIRGVPDEAAMERLVDTVARSLEVATSQQVTREDRQAGGRIDAAVAFVLQQGESGAMQIARTHTAEEWDQARDLDVLDSLERAVRQEFPAVYRETYQDWNGRSVDIRYLLAVAVAESRGVSDYSIVRMVGRTLVGMLGAGQAAVAQTVQLPAASVTPQRRSSSYASNHIPQSANEPARRGHFSNTAFGQANTAAYIDNTPVDQFGQTGDASESWVL